MSVANYGLAGIGLISAWILRWNVYVFLRLVSKVQNQLTPAALCEQIYAKNMDLARDSLINGNWAGVIPPKARLPPKTPIRNTRVTRNIRCQPQLSLDGGCGRPHTSCLLT